jgi:hypothetical protein
MHVRAVGSPYCCIYVGAVKHSEKLIRVTIGTHRITLSQTSPNLSARQRSSSGHLHAATSLGVDIASSWQIFRALASEKRRRSIGF